MISTERLYVTADRSRVVFEGDPAAAFLLVPKGVEIPKEAIERYGIGKPTQVAPKQDPQEVGHKAETRKVRVPKNLTTR